MITTDPMAVDARLPTEAEWEYAVSCWGLKSKGYKYAGSDNVNDVAWQGDNQVVDTGSWKEDA